MAVSPRIAIVGRPNVGKSTLFNRLVGRRQSIVHDQPGVTRDRITGEATLDDEHRVEVIDTGGLLGGEDVLGLNQQVMLAIEESDLLLVVVDGKAGLTTADEEVCQRARESGKPAFLVVNKSDVREAREQARRVLRLGARAAAGGLGRARAWDRGAAPGAGARPAQPARGTRADPSGAADRHRRPSQRRQVLAPEPPARHRAGAGLAPGGHHPRPDRHPPQARRQGLPADRHRRHPAAQPGRPGRRRRSR